MTLTKQILLAMVAAILLGWASPAIAGDAQPL